jgi:DNA-directed RNA polymerase subunit omega
MENQINTEEQPQAQEIDSKYRKILIAAKRSKQLQRGARPRVNSTSVKTTKIAIEEVEHGMVEFEILEKD